MNQFIISFEISPDVVSRDCYDNANYSTIYDTIINTELQKV